MKIASFMNTDFQVLPGSIKIPIGELMRGYRERYEVLLKTHGKFAYTVYEVMPGARTIIHFKLPSETVENFYYDVLFEIIPGKSSVDFMDCDIQFYSNSPSFVYSYAYVFAHWNPDENRPADERKDSWMVDSMRGRVPKRSLLINDLRQKIGPAPTHDKPAIRNPLGIPLCDKSLYFCLFYMIDTMSLQDILHTHVNVNMATVRANIMDFDRLMNERKRLENRQKERKARDKATHDATVRSTEREISQQARGIKQPQKPKSPKQISSSAAKVKTTTKPKTTKRVQAKK